jgi:CTP:phosphocholine cytidylyltransferase-like protein
MKAIIPAAGHGTRFLPVTKVVPKEMLPIGSRPALELIVEEAKSAGAEEIVMVISEGKELMGALNRFLSTERKRARVIFVRRYFYCESIMAIAERVHMQEGAVRSSLFRTRKKLAIYLKKQGLGGIYVEEE